MEYEKILKDVIEKTNETFKENYEKLKFHIMPVVKYSKKYARKFNADEEVVEIAAYFHDITKINGNKEYHHITGAEYAREFLEKRKFQKEKTDLIAKCILNHGGAISCKRNTIEEKIIASADAVVKIDYIVLMFFDIYGKRQVPLEEGCKNLKTQLQMCWDKIEIEEIKEEYKDKYDVIINFLLNINC